MLEISNYFVTVKAHDPSGHFRRQEVYQPSQTRQLHFQVSAIKIETCFMFLFHSLTFDLLRLPTENNVLFCVFIATSAFQILIGVLKAVHRKKKNVTIKSKT